MDGAPENATNWVFHNLAFSFYKICKGLSEVFYLLSKPSPLSLSLLAVPTLKRCSVSLLSPHRSCLPSPTCATRQRWSRSDTWPPRTAVHRNKASPGYIQKAFSKGFFSGINHVIKLPVSFPKFSARFENVIHFKDSRKTLDICFNRTKFFRHHLDLLAHYVISEQVSTFNNIKRTQKTDRQTWTASAIPCQYFLTVCWVDPWGIYWSILCAFCGEDLLLFWISLDRTGLM